jgi:hypothetical protein
MLRKFYNICSIVGAGIGLYFMLSAAYEAGYRRGQEVDSDDQDNPASILDSIQEKLKDDNQNDYITIDGIMYKKA